MKVELFERREEHVGVYFERTRDSEIAAAMPLSARTLDEALENYHKSLLPGATSFGRTVYADGRYVGDIWCYAIDRYGTPNCMLSFCIFEKSLWGKGIATCAVKLFLQEMSEKFDPLHVGAFAYLSNCASRRVLEKNGFLEFERFSEDGAESVYMQKMMYPEPCSARG